MAFTPFTFTQSHIDQLEALNIEAFIGGQPWAATVNDTIQKNDNVKFVISSGYEFYIPTSGLLKDQPSIGFWVNRIGVYHVIPWDETNLSVDKKTVEGLYVPYEGELPTEYSYKNIEINANPVFVPTPFIFDSTFMSALEAINVVAYIDNSPTPAVEDDELIPGQNVKFEITSGFKFYTHTSGTFIDKPSILFYGSIGGVYEVINWDSSNITNDGTVIEGIFELGGSPPSQTYDLWEIDANAVDDVLDTNNIYLLDDGDVLREVMNARFQLILPETMRDYEPYILSALNLPFDVDTEIYGNVRNIQLGDLETDISSQTLTKDYIEIYRTSVDIPETFGNVLDYQDTEIRLFLPYFNYKVLDNDYTIGETIEIIYNMNLYNGSVDVLLESTKLDETIELFTGSIGVNIPLANLGGGARTPELIDGGSIEYGEYNGIERAFIEVSRLVPSVPNAQMDAVTLVEGVLPTSAGYVVVEEMELASGVATRREMDEIQQVLGNGIFVK